MRLALTFPVDSHTSHPTVYVLDTFFQNYGSVLRMDFTMTSHFFILLTVFEQIFKMYPSSPHDVTNWVMHMLHYVMHHRMQNFPPISLRLVALNRLDSYHRYICYTCSWLISHIVDPHNDSDSLEHICPSSYVARPSSCLVTLHVLVKRAWLRLLLSWKRPLICLHW